MQVFRWSALAFGVFYGFSHQSAIYSSDKKAAAQHEWDRKVKLIDDAKAKYAEKSRPGSGDGGESHVVIRAFGFLAHQREETLASEEQHTNPPSPVITNPEDPKFDLEKYLNKVSKESP